MKKTIATLSLILLFTATSLWADHREPGPEPDDCFQPMLERLNLSKAQKTQIDSIIKQYNDQVEVNRAQTHAARTELHRAMLSGKEDKVRAAHHKVADAQEENLVMRTKMLNEIKPYLNEKQLKLLNEPPQRPRSGCNFLRHRAR